MGRESRDYRTVNNIDLGGLSPSFKSTLPDKSKWVTRWCEAHSTSTDSALLRGSKSGDDWVEASEHDIEVRMSMPIL
jgi:hypothetical protein